MNDQLTIRLTAKNDAKPVLHDFNKQLDQTAKKAKDTGVAASVMGGKFSGMGRSAGQAGIQVQQLVGQIQGGTNPMLALSQQAADLGIVLGAPLIGAVAGLAASIGMVLLPQLFQASETFSDVVDKVKKLKDETGTLGEAQKALLILDLKEKIDAEREAIEEATEGLEAFNRAETTYGELTEEDLKKQAQLRAARESSTKSIELMENAIGVLNGTVDEENEAVERMIENLRQQADTLGMTATQLAIYRAQQEGATDAQIEAIKAQRQAIDQYNLEIEVAKQLAEEQARIDKKREEYAENHRKQQEEMAKNAEAAMKANMQSLKPLEDGLVDLINGTKSAKDAFADMARSIVNDLIRIQIQQSITKPLAGLLGGGGIGGALSGLFGGGSTGATTTAVAPVPTFAGGGYTGSGARSGGLDGKGGFAAMLHPNETVVDHTQGGSEGVTIVNNINISTGVSQTVRAEIANLMPQITNATKAAVADARQRGGGFSKSLVGA